MENEDIENVAMHCRSITNAISRAFTSFILSSSVFCIRPFLPPSLSPLWSRRQNPSRLLNWQFCWGMLKDRWSCIIPRFESECLNAREPISEHVNTLLNHILGNI